jgi:hypothetical protein
MMVLLALTTGVAMAAPGGPNTSEPRDPQVKQMAPGWHYTPVERPAAPAGAGVTDGGFEAGSPNPSWSEYSQKIGTPICSPDICGNAGGEVYPHQGEYYLWFGGNLYGDSGWVEQQIIIPPATPILTFQMWIELAGSHDTDYLRFLIDGTPVFAADVRRSNRAYQFVAVDLISKVDGRPHTLRIEGTTHGPANFLVDDLGLTGAIGPSSLARTGPQVGIVNIPYPFTAHSPQYTTTPISYTWAATEYAEALHPGVGLTDTINFSFAVTGTKTITVTAANAGGRITGLQNMYVEPPPQLSVVTAATLPALRRGSVDWGDYDNDGKLDVLMTGGLWNSGTSTYVPTTLLYHNNGDGTFTAIATGLPGIIDGAGRWGDFDNDGKLDVLLAGGGPPNGGPFTHLYRNDNVPPAGANAWTFTDTGEPFTPLRAAAVAWADYNGDGKLDFLEFGLDGYGGPNTVLYTNGGGPNWHFSANDNASLPLLYAGTIDWGDINQDGLPDLLLTGCQTAPVADGSCHDHITEIYRNQGWDPWYSVWTFTNVHAGLTGVGHSAAKWADYDSDGLPDVALAGCVNSTPQAGCDRNVAQVWHNDGDEYFSKRADLVGVRDAALAWGDFDNDGRSDILLSGDIGTGYSGRIYQNNGNDIFTDIAAGLAGSVGTATWADYNNDNVLDVLLTGQTGGNGSDAIRLYGNTGQPANTLPTAPPDLQAMPELDGAHLSWGMAIDPETSSNSLTYNVRIGTTPGGSDVMGPMADITTGTRRVAARGNAPASRRLDVRGLTSGVKYYWSVQAVDGAFAGGPFAEEHSFTTLVPTPPSRVSLTGPDYGAVTTVAISNIYTFTANIEPVTATLPFTYTFSADGQPVQTRNHQGRSFEQAYVWTEPGIKHIQVIARNERGVVVATHVISIGLPIDSLRIAGPAAAVVDRSYAFTVTASPPTAQLPVTYFWDVTDNGRRQYDNSGISQSKIFTWHTSGRKAVRVIAQDALGTVIKTFFVNIDVPVKSAALTGPTEGAIGRSYVFTGTVSPITATLPVTYTWSATGITGGGSAGHAAIDTHAFTWDTPGTKIVTLVAKNINGLGLATTTRSIVISVPAASVSMAGNSVGVSGMSYDFVATAGPTGVSTPLTYVWQTAGQEPITHTVNSATDRITLSWPDRGTKTIDLRVQNTFGTVTTTHTFKVGYGTYLPTLRKP